MSAKERALEELARRKAAKAPEIGGTADKTITEGGETVDLWSALESYRDNPTPEKKQGLDFGEGVIGMVREGVDSTLMGLGDHMEAGARATMALPQAMSDRRAKAHEAYAEPGGEPTSWNPLEGIAEEFSMGYGDARDEIAPERAAFQEAEPGITEAAGYAPLVLGAGGLAKTLAKKALTKGGKNAAAGLATKTPKPKGNAPVRDPATGRMQKATETVEEVAETVASPGVLTKAAKMAGATGLGGLVGGPVGAAVGAAAVTPIGRKVGRKLISKLSGSPKLGALTEQLLHPVNKRGLKKAKDKLKEFWEN